MAKINILLRFFVLLTASATLFFGGSAAFAQTSSMLAEVSSDNPLDSHLTLTNTTDHACQAADTTIGTTAITEVKQNGTVIEPIYFDAAFDQSMPKFLEPRLKTIEPGQSISIPLRVVEARNGHVLESITWSEETGAYGLAYRVASDTPINVSLNYELPFQPATGAPACAIAATQPTEHTQSPLWILWIAAALLVIAAIVVIIVLWRRKKPVKIVAVFVFVASAAFFYSTPAQADVSGTGPVQSAFDNCMSSLRSNSHITGDVLSSIDSADNIILIPNNEGNNDTVDYRPIDGTIRIYWDPNTVHEYHGDGGVSNPCDTLYHELFHAHDMIAGTYNPRACGDSSIRTSEVAATKAQNILRAALGRPERTHYGTNPLPANCDPPAEPEPCTGDSCGETNGDPHMLTFDGLRYDFQAVGEFVLTKSTTNDFAVQVRQVAWPQSRRVAVNQAVAVKIASDTVELQMSTQNQISILVNGSEHATKTANLPGGGKIVVGVGYTQLVWPDSSTLTARPIGSFGLHVVVDPAIARQNQLQGILGNYNGNQADDLQIAGSQHTIKPKFEQIYPDFADSWRITNESSLFTYASDTNTETYTDRSFPDANIDSNSLPGRAAAEALCRAQGVRDPIILENCIIDVALTGQPEFAHAATIGQNVTAYPTYGGQTIKLTVNKPGQTASATFKASASERVFIDVTNNTFPDQCGTLTLRSPSGSALSSGCIDKNGGLIDTELLENTGTYSLAINPIGNTTGQLTLRIVKVKNQTINARVGQSVVANLPRPGAKSTIQFEAVAGQRISLKLTDITLPDQCGSLALHGPTERIASACISNGSATIGPLTLEHAGKYSLTINPSQKTTGRANIQIISQ